VVILKACRAGAWLCLKGRDPSRLENAAVSHQAGACLEGRGSQWGGDPSRVWLWSSHTQILGPGGPGGWGDQGVGIPVVHGSGMAQEVKIQVGHGSGGGLGPGVAGGVGILVVCGSSMGLGSSTA
jgi:hypothetical protein